MFFGQHVHCFCKKDADGNIKCCQCTAVLMACANCPVGFCVYRNHRQASLHNQPVYAYGCPIAGGTYKVVYQAPSIIKE